MLTSMGTIVYHCNCVGSTVYFKALYFVCSFNETTSKLHDIYIYICSLHVISMRFVCSLVGVCM